MGRSKKKSAAKAQQAPAAVPSPKKEIVGKRDAEEVVEKISAKKQKIDNQAVQKKISELKAQEKPQPKESQAPAATNGSVAAKESQAPAATNGSVAAKESQAPAATNGSVVAEIDTGVSVIEEEKTEVPSSVMEVESGDKVEGDSAPPASEEKETEAAPLADDNEVESDGGDSGSDDGESDDNSNEDEPSKISKEKADEPENAGSKTLFAGNLSFGITKENVEEFFKDVGEIVEIRFSNDPDGNFKGFGHVEFATVEAAQKAVELAGQPLCDRPIRLDFARERGAPSKDGNSVVKGAKGQNSTVFVRGFDVHAGEDQIRSSLEEHFGKCGEIKRMSIPKDFESGAPKGFAYIDFSDDNAFTKALELDGSELDSCSLTVEGAKPRDDGNSGGRGGRGGGRGDRFGGGGGRGGRFGGGGGRGGRFGGGGGRGGRFGGGGGRGGRFGGGGGRGRSNGRGGGGRGRGRF